MAGTGLSLTEQKGRQFKEGLKRELGKDCYLEVGQHQREEAINKNLGQVDKGNLWSGSKGGATFQVGQPWAGGERGEE